MRVEKLDHVNIRTTQLEVMIAWYTEVVGLRQGDRPNFSFPGAWMYAGKTAVIHLVHNSETPGIGSETNLKLEHFALSAVGRAMFEEKLIARGERFACSEISSINVIQFNMWDPDGNHIHIDFPMNE